MEWRPSGFRITKSDATAEGALHRRALQSRGTWCGGDHAGLRSSTLPLVRSAGTPPAPRSEMSERCAGDFPSAADSYATKPYGPHEGRRANVPTGVSRLALAQAQRLGSRPEIGPIQML